MSFFANIRTVTSWLAVSLLSIPLAQRVQGAEDVFHVSEAKHQLVTIDPVSAQTVRMVIGNLAIVSQAGQFLVDCSDPDETVIVMLQGTAQVNDVDLRSGESMWMRQDQVEKVYTVIFPIPVDYLSPELQALLWENRGLLDEATASYLTPPTVDLGRDDAVLRDGEPATDPEVPETEQECVNGVYIIRNTEDFQGLAGRDNPRLACRIELVSDIQVPVDMVIETPLTGAFNGNGHTLTLNNNRAHRNESALFQQVGVTGHIHDVVLAGVVTGQDRMGALVTHNAGSLSHIHSHVTVSAINSAGGLVYHNEGHIDAVAVTGDVLSRGGSNYGGIASINQGRITNSYTTGRVQAANTAGGIVAINEAEGHIELVHTTGTVQGNDSAGVVAVNHGRLAQVVAANGDIGGANARPVVARGQGTVSEHYTHGGMALNGQPVTGHQGQGTVIGTGDLSLDFWATLGFSSPLWFGEGHALPWLQQLAGHQFPQLPYFPDRLLVSEAEVMDLDHAHEVDGLDSEWDQDVEFEMTPEFDLDSGFSMEPLPLDPNIPHIPELDDEFMVIEELSVEDFVDSIS